MFTTENAEISDDFWKRRTRLYFSYYKRAFFIKALKYRRFGNDIVQSVSVVFHGAFRWLFFLQSKIIYAPAFTPLPFAPIKSTQLKQGQTTRCVFFNARTVIRRYLTNELTCAARETTFRTHKRFQSKDQPLESNRTHFDIRFNNGSIAMHRPTIIFLLSHKITTVQ